MGTHEGEELLQPGLWGPLPKHTLLCPFSFFLSPNFLALNPTLPRDLMRPCEWWWQEQQGCAGPDPPLPILPPFPVAVWELLPLPWNAYFLSLLSPGTCASEPRLSLVTEGMGDLSYHLTNNPSKKGWRWSTPLFFSNQVSK